MKPDFVLGLVVSSGITFAFFVPANYIAWHNLPVPWFVQIAEAYLVTAFIPSPLIAALLTRANRHDVGKLVAYTLAALVPLTIAAFVLVAEAVLVSIMTAGS